MQYSNRRFSSEEVGAIVRRALESQGGLDDISYEDFEEIARQSGISEGRLRQAIEDGRLAPWYRASAGNLKFGGGLMVNLIHGG